MSDLMSNNISAEPIAIKMKISGLLAIGPWTI